MKKKSVAYLLWLLVGIFGGHCFYLGKVGKGVLYLCTGGLFLIGWLFDLFSLGNQVDLRFYNEKERSFHPKSYIFHYKNEGEMYIGSSNISRSALTSGIEWNYRFHSFHDKKILIYFMKHFLICLKIMPL